MMYNRNPSDDIANTVVGEQLNRMLEQERRELELCPPPFLRHLEQACPFFNEGWMLEVILRTAVMNKISMLARLN